MLRDAAMFEKYTMTVNLIRQIALTGCRRSEIIGLRWSEVDTNGSRLRLEDSKEGVSVRPVGLPTVEYLEEHRNSATCTYLFPEQDVDNAFGSFPNHWEQIFRNSALSYITPHVLRHSFASIGNDLGLSDITIAALVVHSKATVTSKYIHSLDTALISTGTAFVPSPLFDCSETAAQQHRGRYPTARQVQNKNSLLHPLAKPTFRHALGCAIQKDGSPEVSSPMQQRSLLHRASSFQPQSAPLYNQASAADHSHG